MSRRGQVKYRGEVAGVIEERALGRGYRFVYDAGYLSRPDAQPVSLTLPLQRRAHDQEYLFSFFEGLLAEGSLREIQCRLYRIDPADSFGLLLKSAGSDAIGCVTVEAIEV